MSKVEEITNLSNNSISGSDIEKTINKNSPLSVTQSGEPIEVYSNKTDADTLSAMQSSAVTGSKYAKEDGNNVKVSAIKVVTVDKTKVRLFLISADKQSYAIYQIDSRVYFRPMKEFHQIAQNIKDGVPGSDLSSLTKEYGNLAKKLSSYPVINRDDCMFIISSIFGSLFGKTYATDGRILDNLQENCKIRKHTKLSIDGNPANSKMFHDAKYGTPEENAFKQEIEDKQKKDGTEGVLDQQPQESVNPKPVLPNIHRLSESEQIKALMESVKDDVIEYEPGDRVIVKIDKKEYIGVVTAVYDNLEFGQIVTVMVGTSTYNVKSKELKPDEDTMKQFAKIHAEQQIKFYDIDTKTRLNRMATNDKTDYSKDYKDLNNKSVECDIIVNGFKTNYEKYHANLKDIAESSQYIRVMNEYGTIDMWEPQNISVSPEDWPYAVVVNDETSDEPLRKVRINPTSYVNAGDEDLVDVILGDDKTQMIKKYIRIIS